MHFWFRARRKRQAADQDGNFRKAIITFPGTGLQVVALPIKMYKK
jgi:hypothetical protein